MGNEDYIDGYYIDNIGCVCDHCLERNYSYCDRCEEYYPNDTVYEVDNLTLCDYCFEWHADLCEDCGDYHLTDNMKEWEGSKLYPDNAYICQDCYSEREWEEARPERERQERKAQKAEARQQAEGIAQEIEILKRVWKRELESSEQDLETQYQINKKWSDRLNANYPEQAPISLNESIELTEYFKGIEGIIIRDKIQFDQLFP